VRRCGASVFRVGMAFASALSVAGGLNAAHACEIPQQFELTREEGPLLRVTTDPSTEVTLSEVGFGTIGRWTADFLFQNVTGVDVPIKLYGLSQIRSAPENAGLGQSRLMYYFVACRDGDGESYKTRLATVELDSDSDEGDQSTGLAHDIEGTLWLGSTLALDGIEADAVLLGSLARHP